MANMERQFYLDLNSFRELFSGRFSDQEAAFLLQRFNRNFSEASNFVLQSEPQEVRRVIDEEEQSPRLADVITDIRQRRPIFERAASGQIDTSARQFACKQCDNVWWRRVPTRKQVSRCNKCKQRYDPLPRDGEWGWAEFYCETCSRPFAGYCEVSMTSPCYQCGQPVLPTRIAPPTRDRSQPKRFPRTHHSCSAPDCCGSYEYTTGAGQVPRTCVHPSTRRARGLPVVLVGSQPHDSTGSTVDTFLPQGDLACTFERIPMPTIAEDD